MTAKQQTEERAPEGPVGKFKACPANGEAHPQRFAFEVHRSYDKRGKCRYWFVCRSCSTRTFLNSWDPDMSAMTIAQAETEGYYLLGLPENRRVELLARLGLKPVAPTPITPPGVPPPGSWVPAQQYGPPPAGHPQRAPRPPVKK